MVDLGNVIYTLAAFNVAMVGYISFQKMRNHTKSNALFAPQSIVETREFESRIQREYDRKPCSQSRSPISWTQPAYVQSFSLSAVNDRLCCEAER